MSTATPLDLNWDGRKIERLFERVRAYEFPSVPQAGGWKYGCDVDYLRDLCAYWTTEYDWRGALANLKRRPHFTADIGRVGIHFVHVVGDAGGTRPLLMTHGWPSSVYEYWDVIEALAFPSRSGGRREDAFDLVIPSLPGFGWSQKPERLIDQIETAALFDRLMTDVLGYESYLATGGDWGANVTTQLGLRHGDHVRAIRCTMFFPQPSEAAETDAEKRWAAEAARTERQLGAYVQLQGSKPMSLALAAAGNPVGQLAWIVERFHDWADLRERPFESVFSREQLLTNAMIYIMNDAFTTSLWYYAAAVESKTRQLQPGERVEVPTAFTLYPDPRHPIAPRSMVEKGYNVVRWTQPERGGHFPAMEVPGPWVEDVRSWASEVVSVTPRRSRLRP